MGGSAGSAAAFEASDLDPAASGRFASLCGPVKHRGTSGIRIGESGASRFRRDAWAQDRAVPSATTACQERTCVTGWMRCDACERPSVRTLPKKFSKRLSIFCLGFRRAMWRDVCGRPRPSRGRGHLQHATPAARHHERTGKEHAPCSSSELIAATLNLGSVSFVHCEVHGIARPTMFAACGRGDPCQIRTMRVVRQYPRPFLRAATEGL